MGIQNDMFLSGSLDGTVRIWDLRTHLCQGLIRVGDRPAVGFDRTTGLVFAVGDQEKVSLYDARKFGPGPFEEFQYPTTPKHSQHQQQKQQKEKKKESSRRTREVGSVVFSPDGETLLVNLRGSELFSLDSFDGNLKTWYPGRSGGDGDGGDGGDGGGGDGAGQQRKKDGRSSRDDHSFSTSSSSSSSSLEMENRRFQKSRRSSSRSGGGGDGVRGESQQQQQQQQPRMLGNPCFSPDGQFVLCGTDDRRIRIWDAGQGTVLETWDGHTKKDTAYQVSWNPKRMLVATAGKELSFWIPQL